MEEFSTDSLSLIRVAAETRIAFVSITIPLLVINTNAAVHQVQQRFYSQADHRGL